jgi:hypothetical protein
MKRVRFTLAELDLISTMMCIANAGQWGEGDYQGWDRKTGKVYDSLRDKVNTLRGRLPQPDSSQK